MEYFFHKTTEKKGISKMEDIILKKKIVNSDFSFQNLTDIP